MVLRSRIDRRGRAELRLEKWRRFPFPIPINGRGGRESTLCLNNEVLFEVGLGTVGVVGNLERQNGS